MIRHFRDSQERRKVLAWHTLRDLGEAREELCRMGEVLPVPPARSREAYADALYRLLSADSPRARRHLRVLDGGAEGSVVGRRLGEGAGSTAAVGDKPPAVSGVERPGHPNNFDKED